MASSVLEAGNHSEQLARPTPELRPTISVRTSAIGWLSKPPGSSVATRRQISSFVAELQVFLKLRVFALLFVLLEISKPKGKKY